mmetsp:Transcript_19927/g.31900  ORF Transcript_19927/g.31900 Transcript_19927/m.31900 type:complete len:218 (+) Transcript_19927:253-906(+)
MPPFGCDMRCSTLRPVPLGGSSANPMDRRPPHKTLAIRSLRVAVPKWSACLRFAVCLPWSIKRRFWRGARALVSAMEEAMEEAMEGLGCKAVSNTHGPVVAGVPPVSACGWVMHPLRPLAVVPVLATARLGLFWFRCGTRCVLSASEDGACYAKRLGGVGFGHKQRSQDRGSMAPQRQEQGPVGRDVGKHIPLCRGARSEPKASVAAGLEAAPPTLS